MRRVAKAALVLGIALVCAFCLLNWPLRETAAGRWFHGDLPLDEAISQCVESADREIDGADVPKVSRIQTRFDGERRQWMINGTMIAGDLDGRFRCRISWTPGSATSYTEYLALPNGDVSRITDLD